VTADYNTIYGAPIGIASVGGPGSYVGNLFFNVPVDTTSECD
jgi:hypothetical protein